MSAQGVDEHMINVHYIYIYDRDNVCVCVCVCVCARTLIIEERRTQLVRYTLKFVQQKLLGRKLVVPSVSFSVSFQHKTKYTHLCIARLSPHFYSVIHE